MPDSFVLELGLDLVEEPRYRLRFRFQRPGDAAENSLGLPAPLPVTIQEDALLGVAGDPLEYGKLLAKMLFQDTDARIAFARGRMEAGKGKLRLRLAIDPGAPRLHNLRWETLYDLDQHVILSADENVHFSRALSSASTQGYEPPTNPRLRALVFIANPQAKNLEPIAVDHHLALAETGLKGMQVTTVSGKGQGTLDNLLDCIQDGCDILYLVAHGSQGGTPLLFLENSEGQVDPLEVDTLLERLRGVERGKLPLLTVLISCESAGDPRQADPLMALGPRLLSETGIPAVLAMHGQVSFSTMDVFVPVFFEELQRDGQIDRAIAVARARVLNSADWWMPVLFSRLRDNRLLDPPALAKPLERKRCEPETVFIPAGPFWMGRNGSVPASETPMHQVTLAAFRIGKTPVTNAEYGEYIRQTNRQVSDETGWSGQNPPAACLDEPVTGVSQQQALDYCKWLSQYTGRKYTLPNEAQWEKAARGAEGWLYPWGNDWPQDGKTSRESPYGCLDMWGGIREWTISLWGDSPRRAVYGYPWQDDARNDLAANDLILRVYRGGPAAGPEMTCAARGGFDPRKFGPPDKRHGFRVVLVE